MMVQRPEEWVGRPDYQTFDLMRAYGDRMSNWRSMSLGQSVRKAKNGLDVESGVFGTVVAVRKTGDSVVISWDNGVLAFYSKGSDSGELELVEKDEWADELIVRL